MSTIHLLVGVILGLLPISEVRGAIPYVLIVMDGFSARIIGITLSILANLLVPFIAYPILDLLDHLVKSRFTPSFIKNFYNWLLQLGRKRSLGLRRTSYIALSLFVGIPLPGTGAWTGTLVAYVLGFDRKKSILAIEIGVLIASVIVLLVAYLGIDVLAKLFLAL